MNSFVDLSFMLLLTGVAIPTLEIPVDKTCMYTNLVTVVVRNVLSLSEVRVFYGVYSLD